MRKAARISFRAMALVLAVSMALVCCACGHLAGHVCSEPAECPLCCILCLLRLQLLFALPCAVRLVFCWGAALSRPCPARMDDPFLTLVSQNVQLND